jgi:hypothetical protein
VTRAFQEMASREGVRIESPTPAKAIVRKPL